MRSKAPLVMMEQLIMVLVFALCAALCLQCFAKCIGISEHTEKQDAAVLIARNAAEQLKAGVHPEKIAADPAYELQIHETGSAYAGMRQTEIVVCSEDEELFALTVGWQEVDG